MMAFFSVKRFLFATIDQITVFSALMTPDF